MPRSLPSHHLMYNTPIDTNILYKLLLLDIPRESTEREREREREREQKSLREKELLQICMYYKHRLSFVLYSLVGRYYKDILHFRLSLSLSKEKGERSSEIIRRYNNLHCGGITHTLSLLEMRERERERKETEAIYLYNIHKRVDTYKVLKRP